MSVKCSGSDLKAFFNDDSVWIDDNQKNYWINEIIIRINGVEQSQEFNIADIKDADDTEMLYGYIIEDGNHRLAGAILKGTPYISAEISGCMAYAEELGLLKNTTNIE
jgi:hypothetical protein